MTAPRGGWLIVCPEHTVGPIRSLDAAEKRLASIAEAGHCTLTHHIEEAQK